LNEDERTIMQGAMDMKVKTAREVMTCAENQILRRVRAESSRRPPRLRRDTCSIACWCSFLTARPSQRGRAIAEK